MLSPVSPSDPTDLAEPFPENREVLGVRVHAATYASATRRIIAWAEAGESRTVLATGAHGLVEAQDDPAFRSILHGADLNVPDGMPVVWALRRLGIAGAERVYGPDLTLSVCRAAAAAGVPIALYGASEETLAILMERLPRLSPGLRIVEAVSPPYRPLTRDEDEAYTERLARSGAGIVLVGLGCPKQERWCEAHRGRIPAVLLAVGAAFDFHAGRVPQAPPVLQRSGLEWAFRLAMEPRRLWRRYARVVPRFLWGLGGQYLDARARPLPVETWR
ncbi:MAG: WecB/TagA/CpsF family glycosyltransferase [Rubricoccaceae bacterium]|nr:WecB/TagA/CpsF family glycosyltransferase [Rubricoccaceae bacterium]